MNFTGNLVKHTNHRMPQKKCINTFTTKTGTFTAHRAKVNKCEAEALCRAEGQELASFTNKEDMQAAIDMFNSNNCRYDPNDPENYQYDVRDSQPELESCPYSSDELNIEYHVGLNFEKQADGSFKKSFGNGVPWVEEKHSKLYFRTPEQKWQCPYGVFMPDTIDGEYIFGIGEKSYNCEYEPRMSYVCLEPANRKPEGSAMGLTQHQESASPVGTFVLVGMCALVAVVSTCLAVFYRKKIGEMKGKMENPSNGV